jgi:hypothetical protein
MQCGRGNPRLLTLESLGLPYPEIGFCRSLTVPFPHDANSALPVLPEHTYVTILECTMAVEEGEQDSPVDQKIHIRHSISSSFPLGLPSLPR